MPSLEQMRAQKTAPIPVPKGSEIVTLTEGQHLHDEAERLSRKRDDLIADAARRSLSEEQAESKARSRKSAEKVVDDLEPALDEINRDALSVTERLREFQAEVGLEGMTPGEWEQYKLAHPPRITGNYRTERDNGDVIVGAPIYDRLDVQVGAAVVDVSAVLEDLGRFVKTWDGEKVADGEWDDLLGPRVIPSSHAALASKVVLMHQGEVDRVPKSLSDSSGTLPGVGA